MNSNSKDTSHLPEVLARMVESGDHQAFADAMRSTRFWRAMSADRLRRQERQISVRAQAARIVSELRERTRPLESVEFRRSIGLGW